jgi:hypothetical protein
MAKRAGWIAAVGVLVATGAGVGVGIASAAPPSGCGEERSPCQTATLELRGIEGAKIGVREHHETGCVVDRSRDDGDLEPEDVKTLWVELARTSVSARPTCVGGGGGVRWRISWSAGPDGAPGGSVLLSQWVGRSSGRFTTLVTCEDADGVRCRVKGRDEVVLTREG